MSKILIIDDEPGIRMILQDILEDEQYEVFCAEDGFEGLHLLKTEPIDLVILDVWLPNMGGIDVLKEIKKEYQDIEVIIISGHANIDIAVKAIKIGAFDFLEKPLSLDKVITLTRNALQMEQLKKENKKLKNSLNVDDEMIGSSDQMLRIQELISQSATSDSRILILGENGTGKELVAREIHRQSKRASGPFIEVNCAAIPDNLIESELFGHEKGAFTSAISKRKGKFELAHRGTIFLDEIADMSLSAQAKVLRAIQELRFQRVGGEELISVDTRIIAATNKNIQEEIKKGLFREDLYFRLNVIPILVPSLKDRTEDIPLLISYFMDKYKPEKDAKARVFAKPANKLLLEYSWPGNIRELKNFIERINIMTDEKIISEQSVKFFLCEKQEKQSENTLEEFNDMSLNEAKEVFEKKFILEKLKENDFVVSRTAQAMGLYPSNLHGKIKKYGIELDK